LYHALPIDNGGAEGKCLFIDTEGTFRSEREKHRNPKSQFMNAWVSLSRTDYVGTRVLLVELTSRYNNFLCTKVYFKF
jgi:hypothetical protein